MRQRRWYEIAFWVVMTLINLVANVWVIWLEMDRSGSDYLRWEPVVWEGSSSLVILLLIPAILWFDRRFTLERGSLKKHFGAHMLATVMFAALHVMLMVGIRKVVYHYVGGSYEFGPIGREFLYEYLKDFRSYWGLLAVIYLYRFALRRMQGEAGFLEEGKEETEPQPVNDRFLVKKLGREFLVRIDDIDWVEASGNYVNLHVGNRIYPMRDTMTRIENRLANEGFLRVHRSAIVNMDRVTQITPFDTGDAQLELTDQTTIPVSRTYRKELKERLA